MADSRIRVILEAITSQFKSQMKDSAKELEELGLAADKAGRAGRRSMENINNATRNANNQLSGLRSLLFTMVSMYTGKSLIENTVGKASDFEEYLLRYKVLLNSMGAAKQRMQELRNFAIYTPYMLQEVVEADMMLQNFGIRSAELLRVAGNAAAGTGQKIQEIAFWLGRIASGDTGYGLMRLAEMSIVTKKQLQDMGLQFNKQGAYVGSLNLLMDKLVQHMEKKYPGMMNELSKAGKGLWSTVKDMTVEFGRDIGFKALDNAKGAMASFINLMTRLRKDGTLDRWATTAGKALSWVFNQLVRLYPVFVQLGNNISKFANFVSKHFDTICFWVKEAVKWFIIMKIAAAIAPLILKLQFAFNLLVGALRVYKATAEFATAAQWALNVAMDANPVGVVTLAIAGLIAIIIALVNNTWHVRDVVLIVLNGIWMGILTITAGILAALAGIAKGIAWLTQLIPGLSDVTEGVANAMIGALNAVDQKIQDTGARIQNLVKSLNTPAAKQQQQQPANTNPNNITLPNIPIPGSGPVGGFTGLGDKGDDDKKKKKKKAKKKKEDDVVDKFDDRWDNKNKIDELKIELEKEGSNPWKQRMNQYISLLKKELKEITGIMHKATGKVREKAEIKRLEIMNKIKDLTEEIKDNTGKLANEFNIPSFISAMTLKGLRELQIQKAGGFSVSGANFVFQVKEAPKTVEDWKGIFKTAQDALSHNLDNRRRRN